jgi:hypothetical protein
MIISRIRYTIATFAGVAALATLAMAPAAHASVRVDYVCPSGYVCFFSGTNYNGTPYPVKTIGKEGTVINLRAAGVAVPWGSVSNRNGFIPVDIYNKACQCNGFLLNPGARLSPRAPYTSDGYMAVAS